MKRIKTLLIFSLVIALSFSLLGCNLLPWGDSAAEETTTIAALPQWLTLAHRAEAAEEPEVDEEEATEEEEETAEEPAQTATTQPATTQPATTQPAQTQQPAPSSGTPKYMQPGTMEYIAKLQLDKAAEDYKRLNIQLNNETDKTEKDNIKAQMRSLLATMNAIANEIGLDIKSAYGITPPATSGGTDWNHSFENMESPSGWGD
jgi:hypothetical protein